MTLIIINYIVVNNILHYMKRDNELEKEKLKLHIVT